MAQTTQIPATTCAEYIALNSFFHQAPAPVVRNTSNRLSNDQEYILPFSKELGLTEVLAFIAKTKDGWDYIPAVCVKQNPSGTALDVILAINKRTYSDGDDILRNLKVNFEQVFQILHDSEYDKPDLQGRVLMSIISMCSPRVLCRLGLDRKATKRPIQDLLREAMFSIQQITDQKLHSENLSLTSTLFISEAKKVIHLVDRWLKHRTLNELNDLVEGIHHLKQTAPRLQELLNMISNNDMSPSSRSSCLNMIRKVSRYREAARKLYRMAKKFPLVRNMKIQLASLPKKAFEGQTHSNQISNLYSCLSKLGLAKRQQDIFLLCRNLKIDKDAALARYEGAQKALLASKIHAEIQIVAFCEIQVQKPFPRVISSSKDACFLCDTFIHVYGRMHTPKTHGRLYPGWRLPSLPGFYALKQIFNERLDERLRRNISLGLAQGKLPVYPTPNESNLLTLSDSSTTIRPFIDTQPKFNHEVLIE
ncbi:hypothetical protein NUU61_001102 [Penicillium alfredii]|uniref:Uncharacterized protein n=1 Tax=Penicillium alfredii TaxID=1506179 RepID=A0A9W9GAW5_9EURO|nr:uncharacterized protein NUU61_001102 [Penicillium alfredii]KAJ5115343.1 hypothetical protein NUU61_001102 [Penicillium alfredii]